MLPDQILKSRGRLLPDDWDQIRRHPTKGARIVSQIDGYRPVGEIILAHHERLDGLGYPRGLVGEEIPAGPDHRGRRHLRRDDGARLLRHAEELVRGDRRAAEGLRHAARRQLVELFIKVLADKDLAYRHGEDADFEPELALDKRIHDYVDRRRATGALSAPIRAYDKTRPRQGH